MRILVGTLHVDENEFQACCDAIESQTYENYEHLVISGMGNREAHDTLYSTFMARRHEFDLLVKVDADMVILRNDLFTGIIQKFRENETLDLLLIPVRDFFTGTDIIGMNIFRNSVRWNLGRENLFTDMTYDKKTVRQTLTDYEDLAPAASHSFDPSPFQAFHFGFHRGIKAVKGGSHWGTLSDLHQNFRKNPNGLLALALLGASAALSGRFGVEQVSYTDTTLYDEFRTKYQSMPGLDLIHAARRSVLYLLFSVPLKRQWVSDYYRLLRQPFKDTLGGASRRMKRALGRLLTGTETKE